MIRRPLYSACVCLLAIALTPGLSAGRPGQALTPPPIAALVLDGLPAETEWQGAARLPFAPLVVPQQPGEKPSGIRPVVHLALAQGQLALSVRMDEDPGVAIGAHLLIAPEGAKTAADAISIDFRPADPRAPRVRAIGPKGVGRKHYRADAAALTSLTGAWTLEAQVPLADLVGERSDQALRVAVVVYSRTPNVVAVWPAGALWKNPEHWNELLPPSAGWPLEVKVDAARLAAEDAADAKAALAWLGYLRGSSSHILPVKAREALEADLKKALLDPLAAVIAHRPDLAVPVDCLRGDIMHRLGVAGEAEAYFEDALTASPSWREAAYGLFVKVRGIGAAEGPVGGPSDFTAAREALKTRFDPQEYPGAAIYAEDGARLGAALLDYKQGNFAPAVTTLQALRGRYAFDAFIEAHGRLAVLGQRATAAEAARIKKTVATLPRATVTTTAGPFVIELFHDDTPNTVSQFVWLAKAGFYDDCSVHRTVPFFMVQMGDPHTRRATARPELVGSGDPGYAIRTEGGPRAALRGYVALANGGRDTDGSQFMVFTGTAVHLRGEVTVFGRVVAGQDVVDKLHAGDKPDRILNVTLEGLDPERAYHPSTLAGNRAPAPKPAAPRKSGKDGK